MIGVGCKSRGDSEKTSNGGGGKKDIFIYKAKKHNQGAK